MRYGTCAARVLLALAATVVLLPAAVCGAVDFKVKGQWIMSFDYGSGSQFASYSRDKEERTRISGWGGRGRASSTDNFSAQQRLRLQLDAVASEFLSGTVYFQIGEQGWGRAADGGALGSDGMVVRVKHAYIDWMVPNTDLKVRMGLQTVGLPAYTTHASQVFEGEVAALALSYTLSDRVALGAFWARPYNDNFVGVNGRNSGYLDNMDLFGLTLPITFDGFKFTPWAMVGTVGANTFRNSLPREPDEFYENLNARNLSGVSVITGMYPAVLALREPKDYNAQWLTPFWVGFTGEITAWDPWRIAFDVNYGHNGASVAELRRQGWYASLLAEYKMDWGAPGIYAWYSSGDDGSLKNGSQRMPNVRTNGDNTFSTFASNGNQFVSRGGLLGMNLIGTWGLGVRVKDVSFWENIKHTIRINYYTGTNAPKMAKYITDKLEPADREAVRLYTDFNRIDSTFDAFTTNRARYNLYLTTQDHALEFSMGTSWHIYDNLTMNMGVGYIAMWLDNSRKVWGPAAAGVYGGDPVRGFGATDAWNVNISMVYSF